MMSKYLALILIKQVVIHKYQRTTVESNSFLYVLLFTNRWVYIIPIEFDKLLYFFYTNIMLASCRITTTITITAATTNTT